MEYCDYKLEQIVDCYKEYQELCNLFFELAPNDLIKIKLQDILYKGGYNGFSISSKLLNMDNPFIELKRRVSLAYLLIKNPKTFDILVQNKVNLFHGTNANALFSILKYSLTSIKQAEKEGINILTGEKWSRLSKPRSFVSFTDILDIAEDYSSIYSEEKNDKLSFEVIIGTTAKDVISAGKCYVGSDVPEVGVNNSFPKESIRVICVPSDKVNFVKQLISNDEIKVVAIDGINEKFYYIDNCSVAISYDKYEEIKNNIQVQKKQKKFSLNEIKDLMITRLSKIINKGSGGNEFEYEYKSHK